MGGRKEGEGNKEWVGGRESVAGIYAHACLAKQHKYTKRVEIDNKEDKGCIFL